MRLLSSVPRPHEATLVVDFSASEKLPIVSLARIRTIAYDVTVGLLKRNYGKRLDTSLCLVKIAVV